MLKRDQGSTQEYLSGGLNCCVLYLYATLECITIYKCISET